MERQEKKLSKLFNFLNWSFVQNHHPPCPRLLVALRKDSFLLVTFVHSTPSGAFPPLPSAVLLEPSGVLSGSFGVCPFCSLTSAGVYMCVSRESKSKLLKVRVAKKSQRICISYSRIFLMLMWETICQSFCHPECPLQKEKTGLKVGGLVRKAANSWSDQNRWSPKPFLVSSWFDLV